MFKCFKEMFKSGYNLGYCMKSSRSTVGDLNQSTYAECSSKYFEVGFLTKSARS